MTSVAGGVVEELVAALAPPIVANEVANAGHFLRREKPDAVTKAILARVAGDSASDHA